MHLTYLEKFMRNALSKMLVDLHKTQKKPEADGISASGHTNKAPEYIGLRELINELKIIQ